MPNIQEMNTKIQDHRKLENWSPIKLINQTMTNITGDYELPIDMRFNDGKLIFFIH